MSILAKGTSISVGDAASPEVFTEITEAAEINPANPETDDIENTTHNTTDAHRTYQPGLIEPGDMSFLLHFDPANTQHVALETDRAARTTKNYKVSVPTSPADTQVFPAYPKSVERITPIDNLYDRRVTLKVSGAIT